jgi:nitroreductase
MEWMINLGNDERFDCLYGAPALIIVSGDSRAPMPLDMDCAAAMQNMLLAAQSIGLGSCWIYFVLQAFQSPEGNELRKELKIPEGYKPYCSAVFGYKTGESPDLRERKKGLVTFIR